MSPAVGRRCFIRLSGLVAAAVNTIFVGCFRAAFFNHSEQPPRLVQLPAFRHLPLLPALVFR